MSDSAPTFGGGMSRRLRKKLTAASVPAPPEQWAGNEGVRYAYVHPADLSVARERTPYVFEEPYELHASELCPRGRIVVTSRALD